MRGGSFGRIDAGILPPGGFIACTTQVSRSISTSATLRPVVCQVSEQPVGAGVGHRSHCLNCFAPSSTSETAEAPVVLSGALCDQPEGRIVLKEGQGVITEFCNICQALIGHLYDALGQDRSRREGLGCVREIAAKTLQERPGIIERIANPARLAIFKRQRIFNHLALLTPDMLRRENGGTLKGVLRCSGLRARSLCDGGSISQRLGPPESEVELQFGDDP